MILTEAKRRAQHEFEATLDRHGLTVTEVAEYLDRHPDMKRASYALPRNGVVGTAANLVTHIAGRLGRSVHGGRS